MTRQLEQKSEDRSAKRAGLLVNAIRRDLDSSIQSDGYDLLGFSCRLAGGDCLLTLRAVNGAGPMVAFVGAEDLESAIIKAVNEARSGGLQWRADKFAK